jgi:GNAT superfamily N-acetyltransferase
MNWRRATVLDARLLAELNHQLIADEGHPNPMGVAELEARMQRWLASEYRAIVFHEQEVLAYVLFRDDESGRVHVRHFFVARLLRRRGVGREAFQRFRTEVVPHDKRIALEVLSRNAPARAFWAAMGFREYAVALELPPLGA